MKIEIKDTVTLSDKNRYVVVSKTNYKDKNYYYLIDENNNKNIKFCFENSQRKTFLEVHDKDLIQELLPLFLKSASGAITKEDLELLEQDID